MKSVEMFFAMLPSDTRPGKLVRSRWRMTREEIARRGGTVLEHTREVRAIAETPDEVTSNTRPPGGSAR
jgi:hypothetical protein